MQDTHSMNPLRHAPLPAPRTEIGAMTGEDRDRLLSRYSRKGSKRLYHRVRLGLRGRGRFLLHAFGVVLCVVSWVSFALLSGCGLAGPVGVPGPVGATHGGV